MAAIAKKETAKVAQLVKEQEELAKSNLEVNQEKIDKEKAIAKEEETKAAAIAKEEVAKVAILAKEQEEVAKPNQEFQKKEEEQKRLYRAKKLKSRNTRTKRRRRELRPPKLGVLRS